MAFGLNVVLSARDRLSPVLTRIGDGLGELGNRSREIGSSMRRWGTIGITSATAITVAIGSTVKTYQDLARAQGEVESLGINAKGIDTITDSALKFSNTFSGTTAPDFVRASYDIKSGISSLSSLGVARFTTLAALTGKATKSTTEQMTSFFATGYGIYMKQFDALQTRTAKGWSKLSREEKDIKFGETFSAGIAGAVQMFKTNGSQMQSAIETLGATATTSNVSLAEQLAVLGSMQKSFASGSEAATAYKGFLAGAVSAQKDLKLKFVDSNNQLLSAPIILEKLRKKYGSVLDDMEKANIKKAFGTDEGMKFITAFYGEIDELKTSIKGMDKTLESGTTNVTKMALATNKGNEFEILSQRASNLSSIIGQQFAPMAIKASNAIGNTITKLQTWSKKNPKMVDTITKVVTIGTGLIAVLGSIGIAVGTFTFAITPMLALLSPLNIGIGLIAGAGYLLYDNWTLVSTFWGGLWEDMVNYVELSGNQMSTYWNGVLTDMANYINNTKTQMSTYWGGLWTDTKATFNDGLTYIKEMFNWNPLETITKIWDDAFSYFDNKFTAFEDKINIFKNFSIGSVFGDDEDKKKTTKTNIGDTIKKIAIAPIVASQIVTAQPNIPKVEDRSFTTRENLVLAPIPKPIDRSFTTTETMKRSPFTSLKDRLFKTKEEVVSAKIPKVEDREFKTVENLVLKPLPSITDRSFTTTEYVNKVDINSIGINRNNPNISSPKLGTLNTTNKKVLQQDVKVEAPVHITVNSVQGKVDTASIASAVRREVSKSTKKAVSNVGFEDKD